MEISAGKLWGLRRLADEAGFLTMLAVDQRPPIIDLIKARTGAAQATDEQIVAVKRVLVEALAPHASAVLLDPIWAYPAAVQACSPHQGLLLTLEDHRFEQTAKGRKAHMIEGWSVAKIKRLGADGVKLLVHFRPDAGREETEHQKRFVRAVGEACRRFDLPFVLELLLFPLRHIEEAELEPERRAELVIESVRTFAPDEYGVDLFKLESPVPPESVPAGGEGEEAEVARVQGLFDRLGEAAGRPWVVLSAGAGPEAFRRILRHACKAGASGFLAGRAIWLGAAQAFPDLDAMRKGLGETGGPYLREIGALVRAEGRPWHKHPRFGAGPQLRHAGTGFPKAYESL